MPTLGLGLRQAGPLSPRAVADPLPDPSPGPRGGEVPEPLSFGGGVPEEALHLVFGYGDDPRDREAAFLVCRRWHRIDALFPKHVTVGFCYAVEPARLLAQLAAPLNRLKALHPRRTTVTDEDIVAAPVPCCSRCRCSSLRKRRNGVAVPSTGLCSIASSWAALGRIRVYTSARGRSQALCSARPRSFLLGRKLRFGPSYPFSVWAPDLLLAVQLAVGWPSPRLGRTFPWADFLCRNDGGSTNQPEKLVFNSEDGVHGDYITQMDY